MRRKAVFAVVIVAVIAAGAGLFYAGGKPPEPVPTPVPPILQPQPELPRPDPRIAQEASQRCRDATQLVLEERGGTQEERESRELDARWVEYLQAIQEEDDHANWPGDPCDLYVRNHTRTAREAFAPTFARIEARGKDLEFVNVKVTLTSDAGTTILVPAGTHFVSASSGTQDQKP